MTTPIVDFVKKYAQSDSVRAHMPAHKGEGALGFEALDLTEIRGADSLYEAAGIIAESEKNAGELFGAHTFYSTEGSSLCIRAMLLLCVRYAARQGKKPLIFAGRNAHKTFLSAAALTGAEISWLSTDVAESYLSCRLTAPCVAEMLDGAYEKPVAVYITSPDYTGAVCDVEGIAEECHKRGVLLLVDNAHGAYLKFVGEGHHPIDIGADVCCDSAHKTLPCLTGAAYLHVSKNAPALFADGAKDALATFGSTSPSYLILQSLDAVNGYLHERGRSDYPSCAERVAALKVRLVAHGYRLIGDEPLKITIDALDFGLRGNELLMALEKENIFCEFADSELCVLMLSPNNTEADFMRLENALIRIEKKQSLARGEKLTVKAVSVMSPREAMLAPSEVLPVDKCEGRILASPSVGCPPAVPILVCGEVIDKSAIALFKYYGVEECRVVLT